MDGPQDIPEPERYQITLNPDGTISVKADCNVVSGSYTVEGSNITIELGPSTMAMCLEDSLADQFTQHLTAARIMFFDGGDMLFDTFADSGTMRFSRSVPAAGEVPEISQPIYRWGELADRLWVLVGYGDAMNPTVVGEGVTITVTAANTTRDLVGQEMVIPRWRTTNQGVAVIGVALGWATAGVVGDYLIETDGFGAMFFFADVLTYISAGL